MRTFELLLSHGAEFGPRTLHEGTLSSSSYGKSGRGLDMVRYLIDEAGLDVNVLDSEVDMPDFYGTPLCYLVKFTVGFEDMLLSMLERGADHRIKCPWECSVDAVKHARGNESYLGILHKWEEKHQDSSHAMQGMSPDFLVVLYVTLANSHMYYCILTQSHQHGQRLRE